jgi:hypothetical protein
MLRFSVQTGRKDWTQWRSALSLLGKHHKWNQDIGSGSAWICIVVGSWIRIRIIAKSWIRIRSRAIGSVSAKSYI